MRPNLTRTPLESREPIEGFAVIRALIAVASVLGLAILGFPYHGTATAVVAAVALPWSLFVLAVTRHSAVAGLNPLIALGDSLVLGILVAVEPDMYAPAHFTALFLVAAHAHCQGAAWSPVVGVLPPLVLIPVTFSTDVPVDRDGLLQATEVVFAVASLSTAVVVGALREAESSARLRARSLSRRTIDTEANVRRRLAEAIHDGPLQELTSVELMLAGAEAALDRGDQIHGREALADARILTRANISFLRDEIVDLGPHAFEELSFGQAIADCVELWQRRFGVTVETAIEEDGLPPTVAGPLFRITQEAVTNAGKHAGASTITIRLCRDGERAVLTVEDDGRGFGDVDPLGASEPGHIGLASMRERAEMLGGELAIESSDRGTFVRVSTPL
jgi:signal transduction histidine kinase